MSKYTINYCTYIHIIAEIFSFSGTIFNWLADAIHQLQLNKVTPLHEVTLEEAMHEVLQNPIT